MTVQEYASKHGVSPRTVYRWIEEGQVNAKKVGNMWQVISRERDSICQYEQTIERQEKEIEYLRALNAVVQPLSPQLSQANKTIAEMQQRHDICVMSFTKQLEQQTLLIEDMRQSRFSFSRSAGRSLWSRVKATFGFAPS
jgi:excisionase family DNA binding protein